MCEMVLVDIGHSNCPQDGCLQKHLKDMSAMIDDGAYSHIYIMIDRDSGTEKNHVQTTSTLLESFAGQKEKIHILDEGCVASSWYCFKQAVDELDLSAVLVVTSSQRRNMLQTYQSLLFTAVYSFEYAALFDDSQCLNSSSHLRKNIREEVKTFLQSLPAVTGEISILRSSFISDSFSHGFTTRTGGISYVSTLRSLNLFSSSRRRDPNVVVEENLRRLGLQAGFDPKNFHLIKTDHASDVWVIGKPEPPSYDGMVTNREGLVIAAPGADCMPLLFTDPVAKVIGVAHAGWKGTLKGVAVEMVNAMVSEFGSNPSDVVVVIGPSVGPCCFTLDRDSAEKYYAIHPDCVKARGSPRPYVDIRLATRILLQQAGILPHCIQDNTVMERPLFTLCTACSPDAFFSHVRDGINFGTQIGFLWIKNQCVSG
uniref:Purine nucleoside phosphorylase LACC1 n=1 Tax=Paramormyrops kingsleyae TaxID=1676925 RepID=A0A3B3STW1_9TELE|nr:laccase domain-containing protein 1 [Paramormyrops kingsleyae]XP_023684776.1 laccase domain-containing protein 1 [Paramormyrops kingsleyae]